jgi:hypothetical protein
LPVGFLVLLIVSANAGKSNHSPAPVQPGPAEETVDATLSIDRSQKLQTIDGFGFFGAQNVWWDAQVNEDPGITIWRNG